MSRSLSSTQVLVTALKSWSSAEACSRFNSARDSFSMSVVGTIQSHLTPSKRHLRERNLCESLEVDGSLVQDLSHTRGGASVGLARLSRGSVERRSSFSCRRHRDGTE